MTANSGYIKGVTEVVNKVSSAFLRDTITTFLQTRICDLETRRQLMRMLRAGVPKEDNLQIFPGQFLTMHQYNVIKDSDWSHYIPQVVELGYHNKGAASVSDIADKISEFLNDIGEIELQKTYQCKKGKGIISAILLLGGYCFISSKSANGSTKRVVTSVKGMELLSLEARIDMAINRCKHIGLIKEKVQIERAENSLDDLI